MENKDVSNFPILILVPAHTDTPTCKEQSKEQQEQRACKDNSAPDNEWPTKDIFEKRQRGRPKGSKRAEENCSCSNCGSWRKTGLRSGAHNCAQCGKVFPVWGHYKAHMMNHGRMRPHCCTECSKSFVRLEDLRRHFVTHGDFKFKCHKCGKQFFRDDHLKKHKKCAKSNTKANYPFGIKRETIIDQN